MAIQRSFTPGDEFPNLSRHHNVLSKVLTRELYEKLSPMTSKGGYTLDKCIQTGVDNPGNKKTGHTIVGCVAGDEDCYTTFAELFDTLINKIHGHYPPTARQDIELSVCDQAENCTEEDSFDPAYILGYEMQAKRNIAGYNLSPLCSRSERRSIEKVAANILESFEDALVGSYYPLRSLTGAEREELRRHALLFDRPTCTTWTHAQIARDWPDARGLWKNDNHAIAVWVNEVDHLQFNMTGYAEHLREAMEFFVVLLKEFEKGLKQRRRAFMWNDHHGYLTVCPSQIGTALSIQFATRLDDSLKTHPRMPEVLAKFKLQQVEGKECEGGQWFEYAKKLGVTESAIFQAVLKGAEELIKLQKKLEAGQHDADTIIDHFFNPPPPVVELGGRAPTGEVHGRGRKGGQKVTGSVVVRKGEGSNVDRVGRGSTSQGTRSNAAS